MRTYTVICQLNFVFYSSFLSFSFFPTSIPFLLAVASPIYFLFSRFLCFFLFLVPVRFFLPADDHLHHQHSLFSSVDRHQHHAFFFFFSWREATVATWQLQWRAAETGSHRRLIIPTSVDVDRRGKKRKLEPWTSKPQGNSS